MRTPVGTLLLAATLFAASVQGQTVPSPPPALEGIWGATRRLGPAVRGPFMLTRSGGKWRAQVAQFDQPVQIEGGRPAFTLTFTLPGGQGSFTGRLGKDKVIRGHWILRRMASSITLRPVGAGIWRGEIVPLDDEFTVYLAVTRQPDGSLGAYLRNPDRNLGLFWGVERLEQAGNRVKLIGKQMGSGAERVVAEGEYHPAEKQLSIYFDAHIGTVDLVPIADEIPGFFPRGRNPPAYEYHPPVPAADGWPVGALGDAGMTAPPIAALVQTLSAPPASVHDPDIHGLLIARHGKLVVEEYFHGYSRTKPHDTRSAAKVLAATLVGSVMKDYPGFRPTTGVYDLLYRHRLPADLDPRKKKMTVEHLLTMSSGYDCDDWDGTRPGSEDVIADEHPDVNVYDYTLQLPMELEPGKEAVYCSINPNLLGTVVSVAADQPLLELFRQRVAEPLQIEHYYLNLQKTGEPYFGGGARFLPRDFMKLGQMMLDGGVWKGRRILSADYARRAGAPLVQLRGQNPKSYESLAMRYGYLWWTVNYPYKNRTLQAYFASGNGGQEVMVIPELDMVVATYGGNYSDRAGWLMVRELIPKFILAAVAVDPRPGRKGATSR
jgi:CubicO group peptidase (beta-lactamase class C family)